MRFRNLPAKGQTNSRTARLRGEERHEQICRIHDAWPFVLHENLDAICDFAPANQYAATCLQRRIHRVVQNVDEQLLDLCTVRQDRQLRPRPNINAQARLETDDTANQFAEINLLSLRWRKFRQSRVRLHKTAERIG